MPVGPPPLTLCLGFSHLSWRQWWILAGSRQEPAAPLVGGGRRRRWSATDSLCQRRLHSRYWLVSSIRDGVNLAWLRGGDRDDVPSTGAIGRGAAIWPGWKMVIIFRGSGPERVATAAGVGFPLLCHLRESPAAQAVSILCRWRVFWFRHNWSGLRDFRV